MFVLNIVVTVFNSLLMVAIIGATLSTTDRKTISITVFMLVTLIMNLFCIWGNVWTVQ